jgi:hypothetical protein
MVLDRIIWKILVLGRYSSGLQEFFPRLCLLFNFFAILSSKSGAELLLTIKGSSSMSPAVILPQITPVAHVDNFMQTLRILSFGVLHTNRAAFVPLRPETSPYAGKSYTVQRRMVLSTKLLNPSSFDTSTVGTPSKVSPDGPFSHARTLKSC